MITVTVSQCWYDDLGTPGKPLEPTGEPVFVEAPTHPERIVAVGPIDQQKPGDQQILLQLNPTGEPDGRRLFLWQPRRWLEMTS